MHTRQDCRHRLGDTEGLNLNLRKLRSQFPSGGGGGYSRLESCNSQVNNHRPALFFSFGEADGNKHIRPQRESEQGMQFAAPKRPKPRGSNADHLVRRIVEKDLPADHFRIGCKTRPPQRIADDHDIPRPTLLLRSKKPASALWSYT